MMGKSHIIVNISNVIGGYTSLLLVEQSYGSRVPFISPAIRFCEDLFIRGNHTPFWAKIVTGVIALAVGGLLPDIDSKNSILGRMIPGDFFTHRGWCHTIWFILPFLLGGFLVSTLMWFSLGMFLHLFWDNLSFAGVCFFKPDYIYYSNGAFVKRGHKLKLYKAGDISEKLLVGFNIIITSVILGIAYKRGIFLTLI